jgi:pyruvate kinase
MLVWGVQPVLLQEFTSIDVLTQAAMDIAHKQGIVMHGDKVVVVAGTPSAPPTATDFLRVISFNAPARNASA